MNFSQRKGISPARKTIQIDSIDQELRNSLWSALTIYFRNIRNIDLHELHLQNLIQSLWILYFKEPIDTIPSDVIGRWLNLLRKYYFAAQWHEVYDIIEFISDHGPENGKNDFITQCNYFLETENSAYRFVNGKIIEINSAEEINEIETALENSGPYRGVQQHLQTAIERMGDRKNPDYRNSIKESISAVEALCKKVTQRKNATLGEALNILQEEISIHPALKSGLSSLYGYTSDAHGIRHALMEEDNLTSANARFMLIICSAFINYVIAAYTDKGNTLSTPQRPGR